ncbi:hypothetical protein ACRBZJ_002977, partial [Escherichia coli]|nr:hypothetical protein [Escherichia coli]EIT3919513.1 hypothetical protein [Escherichia coli]EIV8600469.1 hypothetical protein [Escherichia coli]EIX4612291.1 hypothetical protein [Escherichia coli]EIY9783872.1 hypothetical protein [Escherichia coli]
MSTGLRFTLEVDGLPPDAFAVVSFHLNQSLSSLFSLDLSLVSQQFLSLEFAQVLDKMAYLTEWSPLFSEPHPSREFCVQYGETDYD